MPHLQTPNLPIAIIGAGVGGLALAQACQRHALPFRLFERQPQSDHRQGHRFRISRDAFTALADAVPPDIRALLLATAPVQSGLSPRYANAATLRFRTESPFSPPEQSVPVDRPWVRAVLGAGVEHAVEYGREFARYETSGGDHVDVYFTDGSVVQARLLVGADGLRSRVRRRLQPERRLLDLQRWIVWGRTPLTPQLRAQLPADVLSWFMALDKDAGAQCVVEAVCWDANTHAASGGRIPEFQDYIYWAAAIAPSSSGEPPQTADGRRRLVEGIAAGWHPHLKAILGAADYELSACIPVVSSKPDIGLPADGDGAGMVTIIGDAAHAMSPMGQAGGDLAIRDAVDLAAAVAGGERSMSETVREFERVMAQRAEGKLQRAFANGRMVWTEERYREVHI